MLSSQVWRAIGWRSVINTDYDGAVLVGGLENELRHFGDPDEEYDFWGDSPPIKPCPYTHEGARVIAAEKKKEKQQQLKASRASLLGISKYENGMSDVNCDEAVDENKEESEEDGCTVEADGDPLEFYDDWFGGNLPEENTGVQVEFKGCPMCCGISKEKIANDSEETQNRAQNANEMVMVPKKDSDTRIYFEDDGSNFDHGDSFMLMFNEDFDTGGDVEEAKDTISPIEPSKSPCSCASDFTFVEIDTTNTINGLNGVEKPPCPAGAVTAAQPGFWRAMTACRPFERAWRPHIIIPGSWQSV
ncbi:19f766f8-12e1-4910-b21b-9697d38a397b [Sclerotinia trifoliorum]|uniref:19f766f8-12e1-4910-b21b-9697d38a397b n=1 Tax=Sclerotinia trifoliorum TaxID=28548 RepID=A0A8H2ZQN4_9HELO|nr:19f766f8-12e1-4910-b21b-9697d38a397b [Sclerotinia trifoliorum]